MASTSRGPSHHPVFRGNPLNRFHSTPGYEPQIKFEARNLPKILGNLLNLFHLGVRNLDIQEERKWRSKAYLSRRRWRAWRLLPRRSPLGLPSRSLVPAAR